MKTITDEARHYAHSQALLLQLVRDTFEVLEQHGIFTKDQSRDVAKDLLFRICAVLDGSAHAGSLNGDAVAPFVGFYVDHDIERVLVPEDGSAMHGMVNELVDEYSSNPPK